MSIQQHDRRAALQTVEVCSLVGEVQCGLQLLFEENIAAQKGDIVRGIQHGGAKQTAGGR